MNRELQNTSAGSIQKEDRNLYPYKSSFVDRLIDSVDRLPVPYWLTYLSLFILESLIYLIMGWVDGWVPKYTFYPLASLFSLWLWGPLAIMTYLDKLSHEALESFSPLLQLHKETLDRLKYSLTNMPARPVIISGGIWTLFYFLITYLAFDVFYVANNISPITTAFIIVSGIPTFFIGSVIYYHSIRQLMLIHRVVKMAKKFNLFQLDPVYSFSRVTAQTGIAWIVMLSLTMLIFPLQLASLPVLAMLIMQVVLTVVIFVLPVWFVHQRLVMEKRRLLADVNQRVEAMLSQFHRCLDGNELSEVGQLNAAVSGLDVEKEVLNKIPTWPWRAGTLSSFLTAILLPVLLFLIQYVLGKWLGG